MEIKERYEKRKSKLDTLQRIIQVVDFKEVAEALRYHYGKKYVHKNTLIGYEKVFNKIRKFERRKHKDPKEFIEIITDDQLFWAGECKLELDDYFMGYTCHTNLFSLSFRPWKLIANIPISKETIERYTRTEIVAHLLWEITWYGFTESKGKKIMKEIVKRKDEVVKDLDRKAKKAAKELTKKNKLTTVV